MNSITRLLSSTSTLPIVNNTSECTCNSDSDAFSLAMISLLRSVSNTIEVTENVSKELSLNTQNSVLNTNKIELSSSDKDLNERIDIAISQSSKKYCVDENLIRSIIKVESNFNPNTVSSAGAKGLMQLMPQNCRDLGVTDPFNIEQNIDGGTRHIKEYLDKYNGDVQMALMAYNGGPTRMSRRGVTSINDIYKMPKETQNYVPKVMKYYKG